MKFGLVILEQCAPFLMENLILQNKCWCIGFQYEFRDKGIASRNISKLKKMSKIKSKK